MPRPNPSLSRLIRPSSPEHFSTPGVGLSKTIRFLWKSLACVSRADPRRCRPRREQPVRGVRGGNARRQVGSTSTVRWWSIDWWPSSIRHPLRANPGGPPLPDASFTAKVGKSNLFGCAHSPQLDSWDGGDTSGRKATAWGTARARKAVLRRPSAPQWSATLWEPRPRPSARASG